MSTPSPVVLLTDFGLQDAYVGVMKGAILRRCPGTPLIDLTHAIPPQDVRQASFVLQTSVRYFPPESIFLVVVDPGVGSSRRPIALETEHGRFVGPDNGVFSGVLADAQTWRAVEIDPAKVAPGGLSYTFHGRDLFAPAAARLACGDPPDALGPPIRDLARLPPPLLDVRPGDIEGEVIAVDHFGNVITGIGPLFWRSGGTLELRPPGAPPVRIDPKRVRLDIGGHMLQGIARTYADAPRGELLLLVNSMDRLEIAANGGNAQQALGVELGARVVLHCTHPIPSPSGRGV